ncbi:MAG: DUF4476 domain-containing protein [Bacteroidia bacterium]
MKTRLFIFSGLLFLSLVTFGQKVNLVIFSEDGDKFYAFVNGIKQNNNAESNVKVTDITPNISLRIEFENKALPNLKQNMALEPGFEHTAKIKRDMKKQLKLRYFGQTPLDNNFTNNVPTVAYHTAEPSSNDNYNTNTNNNSNSNYTTTTTQMSTNTATINPKSTNVHVSVQPIDINYNGTDLNNGIVTQSSTSTTVTTTSSSTNNSSPRDHHHHPHKSDQQTIPATAAGCRTAMTPANFSNMKQSVESKAFSDTKMSTAKVATKNNCMSADQIKEICKLFSMDDDKLTYAKFAYDYCVDKGNYYLVSDVFSFSSTTDDFNKFLEGH